jgi:hypothetical protein
MPAKLFRTMKVADDGKPAAGRAAKTLGVRIDGPHANVMPDAAGRVHPGRGMSVVADDPYSLLPHLLPTAFGGHAREPLWIIGDDRIRRPLALRPAGLPHMHVEPHSPMTLADYEGALAGTRGDWSRA